MTKGFITLATGEYYCWLAEHLYMSYKLFSGCDYPFYVITDDEGKDRLSKTFDGVIVHNGFTRTSVDKVCVFTETPFDETIFIDADCSVVNDLNYLFDKFEENGSDVSGIAGYVELPEGKNGVQFSANTAERLGFCHDYPNFNGGVYYYKKSEKGKACIGFMMNELLPNYHDYELMGRSNKTNMGDEPLVIVAMLRYGFKPVPIESGIMVIVEKASTVKWDMKKRTCSFPWYEYTVSPSIIHWKVGGTETYTFEKYDAKIRGRFFNRGGISVFKSKAKCFVKYKIYPEMLKVFPGLHNIVSKNKG